MSSIQEKTMLFGLSAMSMVGGVAGFAMQSDESFRDATFSAMGYDWASFLQNQGTDLFLVPAIMFSFAFGCVEFGSKSEGSEAMYGVAIALAGAVGSGLLILDELKEMIPSFDVSACGEIFGRCRGDWSDVLMFMPAILAAAAYVPRGIRKLRENGIESISD